MNRSSINYLGLALALVALSIALVALFSEKGVKERPEPATPAPVVVTLPNGELIAEEARPGLSVTIDGPNGVICYRDRSSYNANVALSCMPYAEEDSPIID